MENKYQFAAFIFLCVSLAVVVGLLVGGPLQAVAVEIVVTLSPLLVVVAGCTVAAYAVHLWALWCAKVVKVWRAALWRDDGPPVATSGPIFDGSQNDDDWERVEAWRREVLVFAFIANQEGFTLRSMIGHVSRTEWEMFLEVLAAAGAVQMGNRGRGARWARGWNYPRLRAEVKHELLSLPFPNAAPPQVVWESRVKSQVASISRTSRKSGSSCIIT